MTVHSIWWEPNRAHPFSAYTRKDGEHVIASSENPGSWFTSYWGNDRHFGSAEAAMQAVDAAKPLETWDTGPVSSPGEDPAGDDCMSREEILDTAKRYVTKDRAASHGDAEDNFATIAALWSAYIGRTLRSHDVAALMVLLKMARVRANPAHADNWVDSAGYSACGGEIAGRKKEGEG